MAPKRKLKDSATISGSTTALPQPVGEDSRRAKRPRNTPNSKGKQVTPPETTVARPGTVSFNVQEARLWGWINDSDSFFGSPSADISAQHRRDVCAFTPGWQKQICQRFKPPQPSGKARKDTVDVEVIEISDSDNVEPEDEVEAVSKCSKKNCKNNPQCLNYLGQEKWEDHETARDAFFRAAGLGYNPFSDVREPHYPVGLKNLGATCYANAFLQVWFQDLAFRQGVYSCLPSIEDDKQKLETSPIYQLQITFAALQMGTQRAFNPVRLVESLQLQTSQQEDSQEFSKLFLSLLASEFAKQSVPSLRTLVSDQFEGKISYENVCRTCKSKSARESAFLELEINLEPNCSLEDRLEAMLASERLMGDNKYHCPNCDSLQDAARHTRLKTLPPVLHFSILRFVFDLETLTRKKSKQSVSFPHVLDMSRFLGCEDDDDVNWDDEDSSDLDELDMKWESLVQGKNKKNKKVPIKSTGQRKKPPARQSKHDEDQYIYDLRGILLHKGPSAYHGHYESQVFDIINNQWYLFNDEEVTELGFLPDVEKDKGEELPEGQSDAKGKAKKKDTTRRSSKLAYMLIYARREAPTNPHSPGAQAEPHPPTSSGPVEGDAMDIHESSSSKAIVTTDLLKSLEPPLHAKQEVERLNNLHEHACEEYDIRAKQVESEFVIRREFMEDVFNSWSVKSHAETSVVVDRDALENWVTRDLSRPKKGRSESGGEGDGAKTPAMNEEEKDQLQDSSPSRLVPPPTSSCMEPNAVIPSSSSSPDSEATLLGTPVEPTPPLNNRGIVCQHGKLNPSKVTGAKRISTEAYAKIVKQSGCLFEPEINSDDACPICIGLLYDEKVYPVRHRQHVQQLFELQGDAEDRQNAQSGYWISSAWLKDWTINKPLMHKPNSPNEPDPHPGSSRWKEDVVCEHGQLAVPKSKRRRFITEPAYDFLKTLFPTWQTLPLGAPECEQCQDEFDEQQAIADSMKDVAEQEKARLKSLLERRRLSKLDDLEDGQEYVLIGGTALFRWKKFIKNPADDPRPKDLGSQQFICQHSLLQFDPYEKDDMMRAFIPKAEYDILATFYPENKHYISLSKDLDNPGDVIMGLEICEPCTRALKTKFTKTDLVIRVLLPSDPDPSPESYCTRSNMNGIGRLDAKKSHDNMNPFTSTVGSTRRSARLAHQTTERATYRIFIYKTDTLTELQEKIAAKSEIAPYYQRLFHRGQEISSVVSDLTVADLEISVGDMFEMKDRSQDDNDRIWASDVDMKDGSTRSKAKGREEGTAFQGTLLGGGSGNLRKAPTEGSLAVDRDSRMEDAVTFDPPQQEKIRGEASATDLEMAPLAGPSDSRDPLLDDLGTGVTCGKCTFINPEGVSSCTICDAPFDDVMLMD